AWYLSPGRLGRAHREPGGQPRGWQECVRRLSGLRDLDAVSDRYPLPAARVARGTGHPVAQWLSRHGAGTVGAIAQGRGPGLAGDAHRAGLSLAGRAATDFTGSLAEDDHAAAGIACGIDTEQVVPGLLVRIAGAGDDLVAAVATSAGCLAVALLPRGGEPRAVDVQAFFPPLHLGLGGGGASSNGQDGQDEQNTFHSCP